MDENRTCPNCGTGGVQKGLKRGDRDDYQCRRCGGFSVSGSDRPAIEGGEPASLVEDRPDSLVKGARGRLWLRPHSRNITLAQRS